MRLYGKYQDTFRGNRFPRPLRYKSAKYDRPGKIYSFSVRYGEGKERDLEMRLPGAKQPDQAGRTGLISVTEAEQ